jgi:hypothetical protein
MNIESPVKDGVPVSFVLSEDYPELREAVRGVRVYAECGQIGCHCASLLPVGGRGHRRGHVEADDGPRYSYPPSR